jgi:hypothetical protein
MAEAAQTYRCAYCGSTQTWNGDGAAVCAQCGATQPAKTTQPATHSGSSIKVIVLVIAGLAVLAVISYLTMRPSRRSAPHPAMIVDGRSKTQAPVPASRIVHVDNPHIRLIPKGVEFKPEDLFEVPEGAPSATLFDTSLLVVKTPRRMRDENGGTVFLGEVTNTSPNIVAANPTVTLVLTRGGKTVDKATRSFADLLPGVHVPLFFSYDGVTKAFDGITFLWKPTPSYVLDDAKHSRLSSSVQTRKLMSSDDLPGRHIVKYAFERISGTVVNEGNREIANVSVYVLLRDANGQLTGMDHTDCPNLSAGESRSIELDPVIMGLPVGSLEIVALPVSPPTL